MAKKKTTKSKVSSSTKIGIGLTAAAVAATGAYFLYGSKKAPQNRKKIKGWMLKAKGEVLEALEKAEEITEAEYKAVVDKASAVYGTVKKATIGEVNDFKKEMHKHWETLQKGKGMKKTVRSLVGKHAKKTAHKKTAKKVSKKKAS